MDLIKKNVGIQRVKNGFDLALENARDLFNEAKGLAIFEHYSRAYTLYQLSIEEVGKCILFLHALIKFTWCKYKPSLFKIIGLFWPPIKNKNFIGGRKCHVEAL